MNNYYSFSKINIDKTDFNVNDRLNDIIKLNDFQIKTIYN